MLVKNKGKISLNNCIGVIFYKKKKRVKEIKLKCMFLNHLEDISLFCGVTDSSILTSGGFQSKGGSLACMRWIPQIHLLCDTCAEGQYGVQAFSTLVLAHVCRSIGVTRTHYRVCCTVCAFV